MLQSKMAVINSDDGSVVDVEGSDAGEQGEDKSRIRRVHLIDVEKQ